MRSAKVNTGDSGLASQYNNLRSDAYGGSMLLPHQQSSPNLTLYIEAGIVFIGGTKVIYAGGNTPTFTAPTTNPRIDIVTIDSAGTIAITQGTENASPVAPTYPTNKMVICEVYNRVSETALYDTDPGGSTGYIYNDVRCFLINTPVDLASTQTISGAKTFSTLPTFTNTPSNGTDGANKNYVDQGVSPSAAILSYGGFSAPSGWLICDGSAISRTTYSILFGLLSIQTTGNTSNGSAIVTNLGTTTNMIAGMPISGPGIPSNATILSVDSGTQIHLSANATATATGVAIVVAPHGVGDGSTTFNVPDLRANVAVGFKSGDTNFGYIGKKGGEATHQLTVAELASHTHSYNNGANGGGGGPAGGNISSDSQTGGAGSNTPHNNLQPYVTLNFIIKT